MIPRRSTRVVAALVFALTACDGPPSTAPTAPDVVESTPAFSQAELQSWIRFRSAYGLRADVQFVIEMASDPAVSREPFDVPLLPGELESIGKANASAQALLPIATAYADDFPEFGGAWLELPRVVIAFTAGVPQRRIEAAGIFQDHVIVREVRFSLEGLQRSVGAIQLDHAWFETVGAHLVDVGVDLLHNAVSVHIRYLDAAVEAKARDRFGDTGWMLFTYDGPPP